MVKMKKIFLLALLVIGSLALSNKCTAETFNKSKFKNKPIPLNYYIGDSTNNIICFALIVDKYSFSPFPLETLDKSNVIVIDENKNIDEYGSKFLEFYINKLFNKYSYNEKPLFRDYLKYQILYDYNDNLNELTDIPFNKELYLASSNSISKAKIYGYYFSCCDDYVGAEFYPLVATETEYYYNYNDYDNFNEYAYLDRLFIVTDNPNISKIIIEEVSDLSIHSNAYKAVKKYRDRLTFIETKFFKPQEEMKVFGGYFTSKNEYQYLISCRYRTEFDVYSSGIFIMDKEGIIIKTVIAFRPNEFDYYHALGIVDVNGDGIFEILLECGYHEGGGYELWGSHSGNYRKITSGFFYGS